MSLEEEVKLLREEVRALREENKALRKELEELKRKLKEKNKPDFVKEEIKHNHKKTGQKNGHMGYTRQIPDKIDEVKELNPNKCPECRGELSNTQEVRERVVTDIPEVRVRNTKYLIHRKYCKGCNKIVEPEVEDALPNARFGLRLMLLVLILKLDSRVTSKKIKSILKTIYDLDISDGEVYKILEQLSEAFGDHYNELVKKIKDALIKHIDETSWRINGKSNWLWLFINKELALYVVNRKRSSKVPIEVLGNQEGKIGITDRLSAYNQLVEETGISQQVCWSHLLRNSKDLAKHHPEAKYVSKRMKYIYRMAKEKKVSKEELLNWIDLIKERAKGFKSINTKKFVKSVCVKHREDLFRFVDNPEIEATNNRAERGLRHAVVIRKISNGSRSKKGANITGRLLSITETVKMNSSNLMDGMLNLLQNSK